MRTNLAACLARLFVCVHEHLHTRRMDASRLAISLCVAVRPAWAALTCQSHNYVHTHAHMGVRLHASLTHICVCVCVCVCVRVRACASDRSQKLTDRSANRTWMSALWGLPKTENRCPTRHTKRASERASERERSFRSKYGRQRNKKEKGSKGVTEQGSKRPQPGGGQVRPEDAFAAAYHLATPAAISAEF